MHEAEKPFPVLWTSSRKKRRNSLIAGGRSRGRRGKGCSKGIQTQLTAQITASTASQFVNSPNGAVNPVHIDQSSERPQFFCQVRIAKKGCWNFRREFQQIGKQTVKKTEEFFKGGFAILGESSGVGEEYRETLTFGGLFQYAESDPGFFHSFIEVHIESHARTAFGELSG